MKIIRDICIFTLCSLCLGCASRQVMTGRTKVSKPTLIGYDYRLTEVSNPSVQNPFLKVLIERRVKAKKIINKESLEKRYLNAAGWIFSLGAGTVLGATGAKQFKEGRVVLGRDMIGLGALIPITTALIAYHKGESQWQSMEQIVFSEFKPLKNQIIRVEIEGMEFSEQPSTGNNGEIELDIRKFLKFAKRNENLAFYFILTNKPNISKKIEIAWSLIDSLISPAVPYVTEPVPPVIALFSPDKDTITHSAPTIKIAGLVTDDKGVDSLEIRVNIPKETRARGIVIVPEAGKSLRFEKTLSLHEGENVIALLAHDTEGLTTEKEIIVLRTKKLPEIWAVIVGTSDYKNTINLKYADKDALAFYSYLIYDLGVPKSHISLLLNEQATLSGVKRVLGDELRRKAGKEDQVVIYFAGHGAVEDDPSSPDGDGLSKYLLLHDTDPHALYSTALPMDEITKIFGMITSERIVYIGDTCYSGGSGGRTILRPYRTNLSEKFLDRLSSGKGRVIITASGANEISLENDKLGHGIFTYYLLKALTGEADYDGDGFITVDEAYSYLSKIVPQSTGQVQHPTIKMGEVEEPIVLGIKK